ncbi:MAG: metallophosphoesterase family protein [Chloroflexi bacterium]|nr:metallophosphoesterase family protein [Chloroflexota bacterium]
MAYRILHFADLHLDASFARTGMSPSVARQRRAELRDALKRILSTAVELRVDAITIAGDLYENDRVSPDTLNFLRQQFGTLGALPVVIAPGNHDPLLPGCPYRQAEWPPNVFIFPSPELSPHKLAPDITLWGAAHDSPSFRGRLLERFKVQGGGFNLLLLHASDTSCVQIGKEAHCPFTPDQMATTGVNLALLGHYHRASLLPEDKALYCYPGSPEPLGFDEEGPHYVLLTEIEDSGASVRLIQVNAVDYRRIEVDLTEALSIEDIKEEIRRMGGESQLGKSLVRVVLKGALHPDVELDLESILRDCHESFRFMDVDDITYPGYDIEAIKQESTVRGLFLRKMLKRLELCGTEEEKRIIERALLYGLQALGGREIAPV